MTDNSSRPLARRSFLRAAGAGTVATALAGCRSRSGSSGLSDTLRIGVLAPGPDGTSPVGTSLARGANLAAQQINSNGGVLNADVEVIVKDTKAQTSAARTAYRNLIGQENVHVTTGVFTSEVLMALMELIARSRTIHLTVGAATPESTNLLKQNFEKYKYYFRTGPLNSIQLGRNLADFAEANFGDFGWNRVAVVSESYAWNEPIVQSYDGGAGILQRRLSDMGVEVVNETRYATGTTSFGPIYDDIESANADALVAAMAHPGGSVPAVVQWARQRREFEFGGIHVPAQLPSFYASTQGAARYTVTQNAATPQSELTEKTQPFINAYSSAFDGSLPAYTGYLTFDAVKQYADVIRRVGNVGPVDDVIQRLEQSAYDGTIGTISYHGRDGEFPHDIVYSQDAVNPVFQQWQSGEEGGVQEVIHPQQYKSADYVRPEWLR